MGSRLLLVLVVLAAVAGVALILGDDGAAGDTSPAVVGDREVVTTDSPDGLPVAPAGDAEPLLAAAVEGGDAPDGGAVGPAHDASHEQAGGAGEPTFAVRVVDARGEPLDRFPVGLRQWDERYDRWRAGPRSRSDAAGLARLPLVVGSGAAPPESWVVAGELLDPVSPHVELGVLDADGEPLELVYPAFGSLAVEVIGPDGAPAPDGTAVELQLVDRSPRPGVSFPAGAEPVNGFHEIEVEVHDGHARYGRVGLGLELLVSTDALPWSRRLTPVRVTGPREDGERVDVRLVIEPAGRLRARALDEAGSPLAARTLDLELTVHGDHRRTRRETQVTTDAGGVWAVDLPPREFGDERYELTLVTADPASGADAREARVEGPVPAVHELLDLGDLVLRASPDDVVLRGRVVDPQGGPVAGADVSVRAVFAEAGRIPPLRASRVETDEEGRFVVRDGEPVKEVGLQASARGHAPSPYLVVAPRAEEVELRLALPATVTGLVRPGPDLGAEDLSLTLETRGAKRSSSYFGQAKATGDGLLSYRFEGLPAGEYVVQAQLAEVFSWDALAATPRFTVPEGAEVTAPLLDLASALRTIRVEVVDERGQPVLRGEGTARSPEYQSSDLAIEDGLCLVRTRHETLDAWLGAPGRRTVHLPELREDTRVVLPPPYRLRLRLSDPGAVPAAPHVLEVALGSTHGNDNWVLGQLTRVDEQAFDRAGEVVLQPTIHGHHHVRLSVSGDRLGSDGTPARVPVPLPDGTFLEVAAVDGEQVVELVVDPTEVSAAVEQLAQ